MAKIKVGIVGAGGMAGYHVAGFRKGGAEVVAVADSNVDAARKAAALFGIKRIYASLDEMLAAGDVDAVSVITPNKYHYPLAMAALKAG